MKKKTLGFVLCLSLGSLGLAGCAGNVEDSGATVNEDGSIHLDPGESVIFGPDLIPVDRAGRPMFDAEGNPIPIEDRKPIILPMEDASDDPWPSDVLEEDK